MADRPVAVASKRLRDVKLGELGGWIVTRDFSPAGIINMFRNAGDAYYSKYFNVKKGGIGGLSMLLAAYVGLSYVWSFEHIKHDRWRKYH